MRFLTVCLRFFFPLYKEDFLQLKIKNYYTIGLSAWLRSFYQLTGKILIFLPEGHKY